MKKRLEAELISIAHRVLKLKNKSEVDQLYLETQKLYETLAVLKFYGDNYDQVKTTVAKEDLEEKLVASLEVESADENMKQVQIDKVEEVQIDKDVEPIVAEEKEEVVAEVEQVEEQEIVAAAEESEVQEEAVADEPVAEEVEEPVIVGEITVDEEDETEEEVPVIEAKDDLDFEPIFELASEEEETEVEEPKAEEPKAKQNQISFEDLLGHNYSEPVFVKPNDVTASVPKKEIVEEKAEVVVDEKVSILNEKLAQGINIGLNDRVGFVKYLFNGSSEDFNRVLSQLNTFDTYSDAKNFINEMVKPDYNNWKGQDDFEERFMELVERKFK
jgi:hypothetical protein